jgi:hypothetical protein
MIVRQKNGYTLWGGGIKPDWCDSDKKYHVCNGDNFEGFDTFQEADQYFCEQTGEEVMENLLIKKN